MDEQITEAELARNFLASLWSTTEVIASPEYQQRVWIRNADPSQRSSFVEVYHGLLDDINIDVIGAHLEYLKIAPAEWKAILEMREKFFNFADSREDFYDEEGIVADPRWFEVVGAARSVLRLREDTRARYGRHQN